VTYPATLTLHTWTRQKFVLYYNCGSILKSGVRRKYSLVVLDELSLAINFGLIPQGGVSIFLQRPGHVDIILTGPEMPNHFGCG